MASFNLDHYRDRVEDLYIQKEMPLKEVMDILKEEGCQATKNMYLKKIRAWGLRKYTRHDLDQLRAIKRSNSEDELESNENGLFYVNGQGIPGHKVISHLQNEDLFGAYTSRMGYGSNLGYFAEHPMPNLKQADHFDDMQNFFRAIPIAQAWLYQKFVHQSPESLADIKTHRIIFLAEIGKGAQLLQDGKAAMVAGARIERAFRSITPLVRYGDSDLLALFLWALQQINGYGSYTLAQILTRYFYQTVTITYGPDSVLSRLFRALLDNYRAAELLVLGTRVCHDAMSVHLGKLHQSTVSCRLSIIAAMRLAQMSLDSISLECIRFLDDLKDTSDLQVIRSVQRLYAKHLMDVGKFQEGIAIYADLTSLIFQPGPIPLDLANSAIMASSDYADFIMKQPEIEGFLDDEISFKIRYERAEHILKTALEKSVITRGQDHPVTVSITQFMGAFYSKWSKPEEAQVQFDHITTLLKEFKLEPSRTP